MTEQQAKVLRMLASAIVETIKESEPQGAPAGILYDAMQAHGISLDAFNRIMGALVDAGKLRKSGLVYHIAY